MPPSRDARVVPSASAAEASDDFHVGSLQMYRQLIDSALDYAIYALDLQGHVLSWNPGAERIKGYTADEIIGRHFSAFFPAEDVAAGKPERELEVAAREGRFEDEGWRIRRDGSRFWSNVIVSAALDPKGRITGFSKITRDLSERRAAEAAMRQLEERFQLLVQSVRDYAILMLHPDGRVASWNEGAERIKGYKAEEIVGRSFTAFYPDEAVSSGFPQMELSMAERDGRFEDENWRVRKDGSHFWANVVITALRDPEGRLLGFGKVTRDLTARREAEAQARHLAAEQAAHAEAAQQNEELQALNEQLEEQTAALEEQTEEAHSLAEQLQETNRELEHALLETNEARVAAERSAADAEEAYRELDQFAYVASHDLKAPLRGISNLAQWIQDDIGESLSGESADHMRLLQGRVQRMEALIDGILAYSRAGRKLTKAEPVDTGALVREVFDLQGHPANVTIRVASRMPTLDAERIPLQQVFMNLIGNAVKYTLAVRPDVVVDVTCRDQGDSYEFAIADNGPGIPAEYHERIWGIFQTLAARDRVEGTGIGLSIVKKIVEKRGGSVAVESSSGKGSTFTFVWPKTASSTAS